jgi:hypothetical protein
MNRRPGAGLRLPEIGIKIPLADIYSGAGLTGKSTDGKAY